MNVRRCFAIEPTTHKMATQIGSVSVYVRRGEFQMTDCTRRRSYQEVFGQGFNSPRIHQRQVAAPIIGDVRRCAKLHITMAVFGFKAHASTKSPKRDGVVAPAVEQVPQLYSPLASSIASQWYSAIAE